jgi:hypothetical protein
VEADCESLMHAGIDGPNYIMPANEQIPIQP